MGARAYETADGRFSQPDPVPGGSANAYDYTKQNPVDQFDLSGGISASKSCYWHMEWWGQAWGCTYYFSRHETKILEMDVQANGAWVGALVIDAAVCVWFGFAAAPCGAIAVLYEYWAIHEINAASSIGGCFAISVGVSITWWDDVEWGLAFRHTGPRYRYCRPLCRGRVRLAPISIRWAMHSLRFAILNVRKEIWKRVIRYRLTPLQGVFPLLVGVLAALVLANIVAFTNSRPPSMSEIWGVLEGIGAMCVAALIFTRGFGITLTPQNVVVHGIGGRLIKWSDIVNVSAEKDFGNRTVVLTTVAGKRIRLRAPQGYLDRHFDEKFKVIYACWRGQFPYPSGPTGDPGGSHEA